MKLTASKLRQDIYRILDRVIETGEEIEIERSGNLLKIVPVSHTFKKLSKLKPKKLTDEDSEAFVHIDWSKEWKTGL